MTMEYCWLRDPELLLYRGVYSSNFPHLLYNPEFLINEMHDALPFCGVAAAQHPGQEMRGVSVDFILKLDFLKGALS
jgi:hypothetical protein